MCRGSEGVGIVGGVGDRGLGDLMREFKRELKMQIEIIIYQF